jgi:site-specific DNA recombinase
MELAEAAGERRQLETQIVRDHAELGRLALASAPTSATTARIADLHDRVARHERRLGELRNRIEALERRQVDANDVLAAFADFDNVWNALSSREKTKIISLLVVRVEFDASDSTIAISFHPSAIQSLSQGPVEEVA